MASSQRNRLKVRRGFKSLRISKKEDREEAKIQREHWDLEQNEHPKIPKNKY